MLGLYCAAVTDCVGDHFCFERSTGQNESSQPQNGVLCRSCETLPASLTCPSRLPAQHSQAQLYRCLLRVRRSGATTPRRVVLKRMF